MLKVLETTQTHWILKQKLQWLTDVDTYVADVEKVSGIQFVTLRKKVASKTCYPTAN